MDGMSNPLERMLVAIITLISPALNLFIHSSLSYFVKLLNITKHLSPFLFNSSYNLSANILELTKIKVCGINLKDLKISTKLSIFFPF